MISSESTLTLLLGSFFLYSSRAYAWPIAALLAPVFMIRFLRTQALLTGSLILALASSLGVIWAFSGLKGSMFNSDAAFYIVMTMSTIIGLIPMVIDRYYALRIPSWTVTLIYPSLKSFLEYVGSINSPFGAWGSSSALFAGWLPFSQIVSVTGIWGLSFLLCWFASFINFAWDKHFELKKIGMPLIVFSLSVLLVTGYGAMRLSSGNSVSGVKVAAILAGDSLYTPAKKSFYSQIHSFETLRMSADSTELLRKQFLMNNNYLFSQTKMAASEGAKIIFWAEGNGMVLKEDGPALLEQGALTAKRNSVYLGMSIEVYSQRRKTPVENKIVLFKPDGTLAWQYYKRYPIGLENETMVTGDGEIKTLQTPYGKIAAVICFDTDFIRFARKVGQAGADILFAPSNDWKEIAVFRGKLTKFRALENGFTLVRPTSHGVTEMIDSRGRTILENNFFKNPQTVLLASVPVKSSGSLYAKTGDWFAILSLLIFLSIVVGYAYKNASVKRKLSVITMLFVLLLFSSASQAQQKAALVDTSFKSKTILFPAVSYAPETSMALGANVMQVFRLDCSRSSQISTTGLYTFKNQYLI